MSVVGPYILSILYVHTGLAKAEDKARVHRSKKQEGPGSEEVRKKVLATPVTVSKEAPTPVAHPAPGGGCLAGPRTGLHGGLDPVAKAWGMPLESKAFRSPTSLRPGPASQVALRSSGSEPSMNGGRLSAPPAMWLPGRPSWGSKSTWKYVTR